MLHPGLTRETRRDHVGGKALAAKDNDEEGKGDQNVAEERAWPRLATERKKMSVELRASFSNWDNNRARTLQE